MPAAGTRIFTAVGGGWHDEPTKNGDGRDRGIRAHAGSGLGVRACRRADCLPPYGVSTELISVTGNAGDGMQYFVWCFPICSWLGCCDGAVSFRFRQGLLDEVAIYSPINRFPSDGGKWPESLDIARHDEGDHPWRRRFSPAKTLREILGQNSPRFVVLAPDGAAKRDEADKTQRDDG